MNNKGFTLMELLVVICLMGIISAISVSVIGNVKEKNDINNYYALLDNIESAAKIYTTNYRYDDISNIKVNDLISYGYLKMDDTKVKVPKTNTKIDIGNVEVVISFNTLSKKYSYKLNSDNGLCDYAKNDPDKGHKLCQ